ncbi:MAG: hypothetical protein AUI45_05275 [Acidobacteria bacterium 13_1_40CM_2_56_11]|nr:MAG: hypothetical protein AUI45_05275 [Acidobacteria bacterium 13_1_40CM_2_56_11]
MFVSPNCTDDINRVAVAGIGVSNNRDCHCIYNSFGVVDHLTHAKQADIGPAEVGCGGAKACHIDARKTGGFN